MAAATVVLVHGACSGSWIWEKVARELDARGVPSIAVDLPTCNCSDTSVDASDDAKHVRGVIDEVGGPVVLVGNSYGGVVITGAAVGSDDVRRLAYIAAAMPMPGEPVFAGLQEAASDEFNSGISIDEKGMVSLDADVVIRTAFTHAPDSDHELWRRNRRLMSFGADMSLAFPTVAWQAIPSTYVVCDDDLALSPAVLRGWAKERATEVIEWPADHCPQLSEPRLVADLLERLATDAAA